MARPKKNKEKKYRQITTTVTPENYNHIKTYGLKVSTILNKAIQERRYELQMIAVDDLRLAKIMDLKMAKELHQKIEEKLKNKHQKYINKDREADITRIDNLIKKLGDMKQHLEASNQRTASTI